MRPHPATPQPATDDLDRIAALLAGSRRVLVTGLHGASVEASAAACDIAEAVGAAVDFGAADLDRPAGPTIARAGAVTADPEEMRDRADLVILWGCAPESAPSALLPSRATVVRMPPTGATSLDAARLLNHLVRGGPPPATSDTWTGACVAAGVAIENASCVAIVTDDFADPLGLDAWALAHLVREIAHVKPAFEIQLRTVDNAAAAAVCTWRYGAAGTIARADRAGGRFLPAEASARRLIERREVDCVLAVGRIASAVEDVLAGCGDDVHVIRIAAEPAALRAVLTALGGRPRGGGR